MQSFFFFVASTHLTKRFIREILVCHKHFSIANDHFLSTVSRTIPSHLPSNMCLKIRLLHLEVVWQNEDYFLESPTELPGT